MQTRNVLTLTGLGRQTCHLLLQQALGMRNVKSADAMMNNRTALLAFANHSLPERLCITAAVRQMGGTVVFESPNAIWRSELEKYQRALIPVFGYYVDILYFYGLPVSQWIDDLSSLHFPIINAGCSNAHPAHALADIACMQRQSKDITRVVAAWLGCPNGTMHSMIEATAIFGFRLKIASPASADTAEVRRVAADTKANVTFHDDPHEAVAGANFVFAGYGKGLGEEEERMWHIGEALLREAAPDARLMLGASPGRAIPVDGNLLTNPASLLIRQAEYRLAIHKRLLHWVFQNEGPKE